jgi:hypothetical protein
MWFDYSTERIGGPTVIEAMATRPRRVDAVRRRQGRDAPEGFVGVHAAANHNPGLREDEARVSGLSETTPPNFSCVTANGNCKR